MPRKVKTLGPNVVRNPGRQPFIGALNKITAGRVRTFTRVESDYLRALQTFDGLVREGGTTQGDRRNGKGDFLNDILALLLERCSEKELHTRRSVPGLLFRNHSLDVAYPRTGTVKLTIETKAAGIPKHPGSPKQRPEGRAGSADLEKRIKEAAWKDIDIKGEYARGRGTGGGATSDLTHWLRQTPPRNWLFLSIRARSQGDLDQAVDFAHIAARWFDGCGLYAYGHRSWDLKKGYEAKPVPTTLEFDRVLHDVCTALRNLP